MKLHKTVKRYCPTCKKHTEHIISMAKKKERGPLKHGSIARAHLRGRGVGFGNKGRWGSKPTKPKRSGKKASKKQDLRLKCKVCNKSQTRRGWRTKKLVIE